MKVYIVVEYSADEYGPSMFLCGAFSTKEKAESWIDLNKSRGSIYDIEESLIDENEVKSPAQDDDLLKGTCLVYNTETKMCAYCDKPCFVHGDDTNPACYYAYVN